MSEYFPQPKYFAGKVKVELYLSNYLTNGDLKNARGVEIQKFAKTVDLESLKSEVDKLDIGKLEKVPKRFFKKHEFVKKDTYIMLRSKISKIKYLILRT